jgi:NitT/TauT family transport system ATP-binding protein
MAARKSAVACITFPQGAIIYNITNLPEAIFLSDIVVVFTNRPGRVKSIIPIELKRPRPRPAELAIAPEFRDIYARIWSDLKDEAREFA